MLQKKVPEGEEMASWTEYSLGQLLSYEQPTAYIVESADYNDSYRTPVVTAGKTFILGYTNEDKGVYSSLPVIIFDDFTTASKFVNFKFKVKSSAMKILTTNSELVLPKFIFYRMQIIKFDASTHKRYWIQHYSKIKVRIPPILEQERIVARIEELFSQLDAGVAELKTAKERLKVYRQAVLKEAFEGRYSRACRKNHPEYSPQNDLDSIKFTEPIFKDTSGDENEICLSLPETWVKVRLGEIFEVEVGATPSRQKTEYWNGEIPWVSSGEVHFDTISQTNEFITQEGLKHASTNTMAHIKLMCLRSIQLWGLKIPF